MSRRIGRAAALLLLAASLVAGTGAGLAGHALTDEPSAPTSTGPGADAGVTPSNGTSASPDGLLGADDLLSTTDFATIGWPTLKIESLTNGEAQFAYACQRTSLGEAAGPVGTVSVSWDRESSFTAAQTVAQIDTPPQARHLYDRISGWYRHCTSGAGKRPSLLVASAATAGGTAQVWRIGRAAPEHAAYGVLARSGDRVCLVDVYGDVTPVDPEGLRELARQTAERLG
ncbi:hypothetical protein [Nocardioides sp. T2.26MG-1]|uniref:hypothetical protein n=1 Tax=Nocardioides sp. T2.26MG-1 TaxID=3041166 RepID=UPI002477B8F2|nr:hypothetical protein [Nocardioides sp. T2.26MG-1]CAI9411839.1 hypothetical protein HIDPHFAB_01619 [Nocardioides sp. T2.26MG-1]